MSDYEKLLMKYNELKNDKADVIEMKKQMKLLRNRIHKLEKIIKKINKEKLELSYLITELLRGKK